MRIGLLAVLLSGLTGCVLVGYDDASAVEGLSADADGGFGTVRSKHKVDAGGVEVGERDASVVADASTDAGMGDRDAASQKDAAGQRDAATEMDAAADGSAELDAGQQPPGDLIEYFTDSFEGDALSERWSESIEGDGCLIATPGGRVQFSMSGPPGRCELTTADVYDLRDGAVQIHIPPITNYQAPMRVFFAVVDEQGNRIELAFHDGQFEGRASADDVDVFSDNSPYEPEPSYWRIRSSGEKVSLESSLDGVSWAAEMSLPAPFELSRVRINFGVEVLSALSSSVGIGVSGVNVD